MILRRISLGLLMLLGLIMIGGCVNPFHPDLTYGDGELYAAGTPRELLESLETSYKRKDIRLFRKLLHPDFRFELIASEVSQIGVDVNGDGIRDDWWGYDQEIEFTDNLFNNGSTDGVYLPPDQIELRLQIPPENQWTPDNDPNHSGWYIISCLFDLQLTYYTGSGSTSMTSNGVAVFYLRQVGNYWYIAIWRDESNI